MVNDMLYMDNAKKQYTICSFSLKEPLNTHTLIVSLENGVEIKLTEKEYNIWRLIVSNYNKQTDISAITLAAEYCKAYDIGLNNFNRTVDDIKRCIEKFIKLKMIILIK